MQVQFAFLCDAATESGGKLNALGVGIDRLQASETQQTPGYPAGLPVRHGRLMLVARLGFGPEDEGRHPFVIRVVDADGQSVADPVRGEMRLRLPAEAHSARANLRVELSNLEFKTYGPHEVTVALDGAEIVNLPLDVSRRGRASK